MRYNCRLEVFLAWRLPFDNVFIVIVAEVYISNQNRLCFKAVTVKVEIVIQIIKHTYIFKWC